MQSNIFQKIEQAPKIDFGDNLSKSFELFKKIWLQGLYHGLLSLLVSIPFLLLMYAPFFTMYIDMFKASMNGRHYQPVLDFTPIQVVVYVLLVFILAFIMQVINVAIISHFFQVCKKEDTGKPKTVGGYFMYFKYWKKILVLSLASLGIALLALLMCYFPIFYVMVPLQLIVPIFAFNPKLSVKDIVSASFKLGNKFWLILFGLMIIASLIAQIGIIICFVGMAATLYFTYIPLYYFYKDTIGFKEEETTTVSEIIF